MKQWIGGIDISTREITLVVLGHGTHVLRATAKGKTFDDRFDELIADFRDSLDAVWNLEPSGCGTVAIEGVPFMKHVQGTMKLAQILGAVRTVCLTTAQVGFVEVVPGYEWKKRIGLSGNANKAAIKEWVNADVDAAASDLVDHWTQDVCDAYAIARSVEEVRSPLAAW